MTFFKKNKWIKIDTGSDVIILQKSKIKTACFTKEKHTINGTLVIMFNGELETMTYNNVPKEKGEAIIANILNTLND